MIDMWKEYDIKGTARWRIGGLELWARNRGEDIDIAREASAFDPAKEFRSEFTEEAKPPKGLTWQRFTGIRNGKILLKPVLSALPFLVQLETPMCILPNMETSFCIRLPLSLSLSLPDGRVLTEAPLFRLSKAWFGTMDSGVLCSSVSSPVFPEPGKTRAEPQAARAICPVTVKNLSKSALELKAITVYTEGLSVLSLSELIYTDWMLISFDAEGDLKLNIKDRNAGLLKAALPLSDARVSAGETLVKRYMDFFKTIRSM